MALCEADLRCPDTHAHLDNLVFDSRPKNAIRHYGVRLHRYEQFHDQEALNLLLAYNKQDTANLYPLAEKLMGFIDAAQAIPLENWS